MRIVSLATLLLVVGGLNCLHNRHLDKLTMATVHTTNWKRQVQLQASTIPSTEQFPWQPPELVAVLGQHTQYLGGEPFCVAYSPDGKHLATAGQDQVVRLWDPGTLQPQAVFLGHTDTLFALRFAPDGRTLASADRVGTLRLWDLANPQPTCRAVLQSPRNPCVWSIAFSADSTLLAGADGTRTVRLWKLNREGLTLRQQLDHPEEVRLLALAGDGRTLASLSVDDDLNETFRVWDLAGPQPVLAWQGPLEQNATINSMTFSPDGHWLAVGLGRDAHVPGVLFPSPGHVHLLQVDKTGPHIVADLLDGRHHRVNTVAFGRSGQQLACACADGTIHFWDLKDHKPDGHQVLTDRPLNSLWGAGFTFALSPRGDRLATVGRHDHQIGVWDLEATPPRRLHPTPRSDPVAGFWGGTFVQGGHTLAALSRDGHIVEALNSESLPRLDQPREVWLWNLGGKQAVARPVLKGQGFVPGGTWFSPDGHHLLSDSESGVVNLWDLTGDKVVWRASVKGDGLLAFSADGKLLATAEADYVGTKKHSNTIYFWDWTALPPREVAQYKGLEHPVVCLAFSPDRSWVAYTSWGTVRLGRLAGGELQEEAVLPRSRNPDRLTFAPDSKTLLQTERSPEEWEAVYVRLWDLTQSPPRFRKEVKVEGVMARSDTWGLLARFTPDGQHFLLVGDDLIVAYTRSGQKVYERKLVEAISGADLAPDGRHLALTNRNGTIYILRLPALKDLAPLPPK
jgi:WD40 repeat protein